MTFIYNFQPLWTFEQTNKQTILQIFIQHASKSIASTEGGIQTMIDRLIN